MIPQIDWSDYEFLGAGFMVLSLLLSLTQRAGLNAKSRGVF